MFATRYRITKDPSFAKLIATDTGTALGIFRPSPLPENLFCAKVEVRNSAMVVIDACHRKINLIRKDNPNHPADLEIEIAHAV